MKTIEELREYFKDFNRIATLPRSNNFLKTYTPKFPAVIMFGSEANGLSEELIEFSTESVKIEMSKTVESLNLATSVSIILYKILI
jgi:tRNA G18 (ribose-2'-O)-methylase SpoU